jgi:MauM/NapG family ferredoxin protein
MRAFFQGVSLFIFTLLFILATYKLPEWLPADVYLRLDPLVGLSALFAAKRIIHHSLVFLLLIGATLAFGRFFCGYACPMGAAIDFLRPLFGPPRNPPDGKSRIPLVRVKFFLLILFLSAAVAGLSLTYLLDPLPLLTRFYTFFLYPLVVTVINLMLDWLRPLWRALGWIELAHLGYFQPVYYMSFVTLLILAAIIALNRLTRRFWCRYLCPLGALLALLSPLSLFRRRVSAECSSCGHCQKACLMAAIDDDPRKTNFAECIHCHTCQKVCPKKAIAFPVFPSAEDLGGEYSPIDLSRRGFFYGAAGGLTLAFLASRSPFSALRGKRKLIRAPGSLPEDDFLRTCIRCGECMKSCLTNTLQPSFWESGLTGLWTPRMDLRFAPCEQNCNICGRVCPTQAIRPLSLEEKTHAKVGTAVLRKELCLVWAQDKLCLICDEICPYNAIVFRPSEGGVRRPVVVASRCNGCGFCEQRCPVLGDSAIEVVPHGEIRLKEGSYIEEAKKLQLEFKPNPGDDHFLLENPALKEEGRLREEKNAHPEMPKLTQPKGFL